MLGLLHQAADVVEVQRLEVVDDNVGEWFYVGAAIGGGQSNDAHACCTHSFQPVEAVLEAYALAGFGTQTRSSAQVALWVGLALGEVFGREDGIEQFEQLRVLSIDVLHLGHIAAGYHSRAYAVQT